MRKLNLIFVGACLTATLAISACATQDTTSVVAEAAPVIPVATKLAPVATEPAPVMAKTVTTTVAETNDKKDPNRRVCKRQSVPGSNMKKRVCASAAQWAAEEKKAREFTNGIQKGNRSNASGN